MPRYKTLGKDRTFGIEIECGNSALEYRQVAEAMKKAKFKMATIRTGRRSNTGYSVGCDGSGIEVRTPILKGEEGFEEVHKIMGFLRDDLGCWVSSSDGMHVHHGAAEFHKSSILAKRLLDTWLNNQKLIVKLTVPNRRNYGPCALVREEHKTNFAKKHPYYNKNNNWKNYGGRRAINFSTLNVRGTIELRLHEGCLDPARALRWVIFGQKLLDSAIANKEPLSCAKSLPDLLATLGMGAEESKELVKPRRSLPLPYRYHSSTYW